MNLFVKNLVGIIAYRDFTIVCSAKEYFTEFIVGGIPVEFIPMLLVPFHDLLAKCLAIFLKSSSQFDQIRFAFELFISDFVFL